jgi:hypothetical protein
MNQPVTLCTRLLTNGMLAYADNPLPPPPELDDEDLRPLPSGYDSDGRRCNTPMVPKPAKNEAVPAWAFPALTICPTSDLWCLVSTVRVFSSGEKNSRPFT